MIGWASMPMSGEEHEAYLLAVGRASGGSLTHCCFCAPSCPVPGAECGPVLVTLTLHHFEKSIVHLGPQGPT